MAKSAVLVDSQNWWLLLIKGIVGILFGLVAITQPAITLVALSFFFALFLVISGTLDMVSSVMARDSDDMWWLKLLVGLFELGVGVYLFQRPGLALASFVVFVALFLIVRGVIDLVVAFDRSLDSSHKALLALAGSLGLLAGIVIWRYPVEGTLAFVWVLGLYALITGPLWVVLAYDAKNN